MDHSTGLPNYHHIHSGEVMAEMPDAYKSYLSDYSQYIHTHQSCGRKRPSSTGLLSHRRKRKTSLNGSKSSAPAMEMVALMDYSDSSTDDNDHDDVIKQNKNAPKLCPESSSQNPNSDGISANSIGPKPLPSLTKLSSTVEPIPDKESTFIGPVLPSPSSLKNESDLPNKSISSEKSNTLGESVENLEIVQQRTTTMWQSLQDKLISLGACDNLPDELARLHVEFSLSHRRSKRYYFKNHRTALTQWPRPSASSNRCSSGDADGSTTEKESMPTRDSSDSRLVASYFSPTYSEHVDDDEARGGGVLALKSSTHPSHSAPNPELASGALSAPNKAGDKCQKKQHRDEKLRAQLAEFELVCQQLDDALLTEPSGTSPLAPCPQVPG